MHQDVRHPGKVSLDGSPHVAGNLMGLLHCEVRVHFQMQIDMELKSCSAGVAFFHAERAWYRMLIPASSAEGVARVGYLGFALGLRVVVPGLAGPMLALALRILPHRIVIPIIGWLLRPGGESGDAGR